VLRVNQNHPQSFETDGIWAGIVPGFEATSGELRLAPGDVMLLYTDGMIEEKNGAGEMFGPERLFRALERARHEPVATIRDVLLEAAESWADVQADDRTLIVVRYAPA
jgi:sigma-B regulation protein RsbU (phosphoserine phosphatase)